MKYKVGDNFRHKRDDDVYLEIRGCINGIYLVLDEDENGFVKSKKQIDEQYTLITPKAPVPGKVYKVWDHDPKINGYAAFKCMKEGSFLSDKGSLWENWELVVQEAE